MEITHQLMRYVCEVAKKGNFHKAATACHTSQPNISIQIKKLENYYNFKIFTRNNRYVAPTSKGKEVIATFESILNQLQHLESLDAKKAPNEFRLGVFSSIAPYILPIIIKTFKSHFPTIHLVIIEDFTQRLVAQAKKGTLDCIILAHEPELSSQFNTKVLFSEPFFLGVCKTHELALKKKVSLQTLQNEHILLLKEGHCLRDNVLEFCKKHNITSYHQFESGSLETLKSLIAINYGVGFIPKICIKKDSSINYIALDSSLIQRTISVFYSRSYAYDSFLNSFIKKLLTAIKT